MYRPTKSVNSMKELSIKVSIAGRIYPVTVKEEEEESIRKAVKEIDNTVMEYEKNYAVKDKQDLLAMCALQYATQKIELDSSSLSKNEGITDKLQRLSELVSSNL